MQNRFSLHRLLVLLALLVTVGWSATASARPIPKVLRPNTRTMFLTHGFGVGRGIANCGRRCSLDQWSQRFEWGYHFKRRLEGPAIGANLDLGFGNSAFRMQPSFGFWWDIMVRKDLGVYVTPAAKAGYGFVTQSGFTSHYAVTGFSVAGRLSLADRWLVYARPLDIDLAINSGGVIPIYTFMIGGGVTF